MLGQGWVMPGQLPGFGYASAYFMNAYIAQLYGG